MSRSSSGYASSRERRSSSCDRRSTINKGTALLELAEALGVSDHRGTLGGSLLYAGDDRDGRRCVSRASARRQWSAITVHVGEGSSQSGTRTDAEFAAPDPPALSDLLEWFVSIA